MGATTSGRAGRGARAGKTIRLLRWIVDRGERGLVASVALAAFRDRRDGKAALLSLLRNGHIEERPVAWGGGDGGAVFVATARGRAASRAGEVAA